jgi:hypothetical protein
MHWTPVARPIRISVDALRVSVESTFEHWFGDDLSYHEILRRAGGSIASEVAAAEDAIAESVFETYRQSLTPSNARSLIVISRTFERSWWRKADSERSLAAFLQLS